MRSAAAARAARAVLVAVGLVIAAVPAGAVQLTAGAGSGIAGQTVDVNINTSNLTGLGVLSYQFALTFDPNYLSVTNVISTGTVSAPWGAPTFNATSGRVAVSAAGTSVLSGSGPLVTIRFLINPAATGGGGSYLTFQSFLFNEGSPADTTTYGLFTVGVTPTITVSPNTGELVRGQTLAFGVFGSVTTPVSWATTDPTVATISSAGLLTGVAPGAVRVFAVDAASRRDTTDGSILVRGMGVTVGSATVLQGNAVSVPVTVTSLNGLGVRSGQLQVAFDPNYFAPTGATVAGTMLAGYGITSYGVTGNVVNFGFAGSTDLTGAGTLVYLNFTAGTVYSGGTYLTLNTALFNETLPAVRTNGLEIVSTLPALTVSPYTVTLLAGQTQQFTAGGSPTPPLTWSTLDPTVATINSSGLLTAVAGGVTQVRVVDVHGASGTSGAVTVYDCRISLPASIDAAPGATVQIPLAIDRDPFPLNIYSMQYTLNYSAGVVTGASAPSAGLTSAWGPPTYNSQTGRILVSSAGSQTLGHGGPVMGAADLHISPSAVPGTYVPLTLTGFMLNEGRPSALVVNGQLHITNTPVGVAGGPGAPLALGPARPNPLRDGARMSFTIPTDGAGARVLLQVFAMDGRLVRTLQDGPLPPGTHEAAWDGRDAAGRRVSAGGYVCRLGWNGRSLERKLMVVR